MQSIEGMAESGEQIKAAQQNKNKNKNKNKIKIKINKNKKLIK